MIEEYLTGQGRVKGGLLGGRPFGLWVGKIPQIMHKGMSFLLRPLVHNLPDN